MSLPFDIKITDIFRYDYENCSSEDGDKIMDILKKLLKDPATIGKSYKIGDKEYIISRCENFTYTDPVDDSTSSNQGIQVIFNDDSRIIYRLSGTGSQGATVRMYVESYESNPVKVKMIQSERLKLLVSIGLDICQIQKITGRIQPTVIT